MDLVEIMDYYKMKLTKGDVIIAKIGIGQNVTTNQILL